MSTESQQNSSSFAYNQKVSEWTGYATRAFEDIEKDSGELKTDLKELRKEISKIHNKLTTQSIKVGIISAVCGVIGGIIITFLLKTLFK
jgi:hypothetical protein